MREVHEGGHKRGTREAHVSPSSLVIYLSRLRINDNKHEYFSPPHELYIPLVAGTMRHVAGAMRHVTGRRIAISDGDSIGFTNQVCIE
jgi:hypothetical protein